MWHSKAFHNEENSIAEWDGWNDEQDSPVECKMHEASSSTCQGFWVEIVDAAGYLVNRSPHTRLEEGIPKEKWSGKKVELGHLRVFGCTAYVHIATGEQSKLNARSKKMYS